MDTWFFCCLAIFLVCLRAILEEFWTILQVLISWFTPCVDLKRKYGDWAVVTGATDGIGKAFSFEFARRGLNVVLISRNYSKLEKVAAEIRGSYSVDIRIIAADFGKGREIYGEIKEGLKGIKIGILVNNVGIQYTYPMYYGELPENEVWDLLNVNMGSVTQMTRMVLPKMLEAKRGAIINVSSGSKLQPLPFMNLYAASKIFIDYFTDALRSEYKNAPITIQSLCPYYVSTKINHFSSRLMKINIFVPTPERYVKSALNTLGKIDNTTGYWPHRIQYLLFFLVPTWIKVYFGGLFYKSMRKSYIKSLDSSH